MTKDQEETDYYWDRLTEGGEESMCGWLKDKFGVSWQVSPIELIETDERPRPRSGAAGDAGDAAAAAHRHREIRRAADSVPA